MISVFVTECFSCGRMHNMEACADMFKNGVSLFSMLTLWMLFAAEEKLSKKVAGG